MLVVPAMLQHGARLWSGGVTRMDPTHNIPPTALSSEKKCYSTPPRSSSSPQKKPGTSSNNLSFQEASPSPRARRKSLRRSAGKKRRRTLPPIYHNATALSDAISLSLPENERIMALILACFQYSIIKLENSLSHVEGFHAESFSGNVAAVREKITRYTERLSRDGTLKRCIEEMSSMQNSEDLEHFQAKVKDDISVFASECRRWEELLEDYKRKAEDLSRQQEENGAVSGPSESRAHLQSSQQTVLQSKPDYKAMLNQQGAVFDNMEITLDELQQSVRFMESFSSDTTSHLQQLSTRLKSRYFKPMEDSPARTFLKVFKK
ncbi:kinetochore-associated protein DSN1 homolog isoform X2 [Hyperolius riggenbachi]|uniref:kinetochore-associated protein DSN1 homolog isoform X2 n=1 Tax=Hyperolius riggenbachi TaxID=752182 RepID=UPI0035A3066A